MQPVAAHRGAVVHDLREVVELLAGRLHQLAVLILDVDEGLAVDVLEHLVEIGIDRIGIVPGHARDLLGEGATLLAVQIAHGEEHAADDLLVGLRLARRIDRLPLPLHPARGVGERPVLLAEARGRQEIDLGGNVLGTVNRDVDAAGQQGALDRRDEGSLAPCRVWRSTVALRLDDLNPARPAMSREGFGPYHRRMRLMRGVSLAEIARVTKVSEALWAGLERNDCSRWPSGIIIHCRW